MNRLPLSLRSRDMRSKSLFSVLAAAIAMAAVGCGSSDTSAPSTTGTPEPAEIKAGFKDLILTDDESSKAPKASFTPTTPKIFVFYNLEKVPNGDKLRSVWICEKSEGIPANTKIDEATVEVGLIDNTGNFSLSKPTKGWPVGDYKVELYWNDKLAETVPFKVAP